MKRTSVVFVMVVGAALLSRVIPALALPRVSAARHGTSVSKTSVVPAEDSGDDGDDADSDDAD